MGHLGGRRAGGGELLLKSEGGGGGESCRFWSRTLWRYVVAAVRGTSKTDRV